MKKRILLVDDEEWTKEALQAGLNPLQYELLYSNGVDSAIKMIKKTKDIALVVLDLMMPGKTGFDFLAYLKDKNISLKVVVLSALNDAAPAVEAMKMGAIDYITKPFNKSDVRIKILKILE